MTLVYYGILIAAFLTALAFIGVPVQTLVASAGIVIVVLGIALRESLANFAATVIFLLLPPYKVGDVIETCGITGVVTEIQLFHTVLTTFDMKVVTLPNGQISNTGITNRSRIGILRADINVCVGYKDDLVKAKHILEEMLAGDERVLKDPPAVVVVEELGANGVVLSSRGFVKSEDQWQVRVDLMERIKLRFDEAGITIAVPQREVHVAPTD
jgi:small conductance mechanosensitive channel